MAAADCKASWLRWDGFSLNCALVVENANSLGENRRRLDDVQKTKESFQGSHETCQLAVGELYEKGDAVISKRSLQGEFTAHGEFTKGFLKGQ